MVTTSSDELAERLFGSLLGFIDVVAVHLVGGLVGSILLGFFADASINPVVADEGVFLGGGASLLGDQIIASVAVLVYSFVVSFIIGKVIDVTMGLQTIILAHVVFNLAFVCLVVRARLKSFDWSIVEASTDLGASVVTTFRRVTLPVILPAVVAGALLAFTLSVDEFIIAFFTAGAGRSSITLPMQIYSMIRFGITPEVNALATIVMGVSATALLISQWLNREQQVP